MCADTNFDYIPRAPPGHHLLKLDAPSPMHSRHMVGQVHEWSPDEFENGQLRRLLEHLSNTRAVPRTGILDVLSGHFSMFPGLGW